MKPLSFPDTLKKCLFLAVLMPFWAGSCLNQDPALANVPSKRILTASYYSVASLKREGTWTVSHGTMANGKQFSDSNLTCATRLYLLGTVLLVTNQKNGKSVLVRVTDRIGKRFADTRIDLSKRAFESIADLSEGLIPVEIMVVK